MLSPKVFSDIIAYYLPEPHASLLSGIILGIPFKSGVDLTTQLRTVGLTHITVLSGMNITILTAFFAKINLFFSKTISCLIAIILIIIFVLFVGLEAPIIRAALMSILTYVAIIFNRKTFSLYSLLISFLIIIAYDSSSLSSLSFQLSYASTLGIIIFSNIRSNNFILDELIVSFSAQIFTIPLIMIKFKQICLIALVSNLLVSWIIAPLMILGLTTVILGGININLGWIPANLCFGLLSYMVKVIEYLAKIPFASLNY